MLANPFEKCQSKPNVLQSASFSRPRPHVQGAANPCSFGLSPEFSTPVEKPVENRPNERLGADSRPYRNKGEPSLVLHVVPAHVVHRRRSRFDRRPGPERGLHG